MLQVRFDCRNCFLAERYDSLLVAFAVAEAIAFFQVQVANFERRQLRNSAASGVEQLEHRTVASRPGVRRLRGREQGVDFIRREHCGDALPEFLRDQKLRLILREHRLQLQIAKENIQ